MPRRPRYRKSALEGLLVVDKPLGWSSMDVVRRVRDAAGFVKTGHAGTLDPLATGVVICCLGRATRAVDALMALPKRYETVIDLSAFTSTDDREGPREEVDVDRPPTEAGIDEALQAFVGEIEQAPPAYSAVHVEGKRAYDRARAGEALELPTRLVRVDAIRRLRYDWPELALSIDCGKGFYVRSLARDLGVRLGCGGHLASLRRTAIGEYDLARAVGPERLMEPIGADDLLPTPP
ncbi:MAG: tRNA pseudouridine(55) synthase TruB [Planctomycetota bacterium]